MVLVVVVVVVVVDDVQVEELVKDLEDRLHQHNIFTPPRVNQRQPDTTMTQNEIILKVFN